LAGAFRAVFTVDQTLQEETEWKREKKFMTGSRCKYRGADKSLPRPGRKKGTAREDFDFDISYIQNWRNISTIYIYI